MQISRFLDEAAVVRRFVSFRVVGFGATGRRGYRVPCEPPGFRRVGTLAGPLPVPPTGLIPKLTGDGLAAFAAVVWSSLFTLNAGRVGAVADCPPTGLVPGLLRGDPGRGVVTRFFTAAGRLLERGRRPVCLDLEWETRRALLFGAVLRRGRCESFLPVPRPPLPPALPLLRFVLTMIGAPGDQISSG